MGAAIEKIWFKKGRDKLAKSKFNTLNDIEINTLEGDRMLIGDLVKDTPVYLIVNVASK